MPPVQDVCVSHVPSMSTRALRTNLEELIFTENPVSLLPFIITGNRGVGCAGKGPVSDGYSVLSAQMEMPSSELDQSKSEFSWF